MPLPYSGHIVITQGGQRVVSSIPGYELFRPDDLLSVDEVADIMGVNVATLGLWRMRHTGPDYQRLSRSLVFYQFGAVVAWHEHLSEKA